MIHCCGDPRVPGMRCDPSLPRLLLVFYTIRPFTRRCSCQSLRKIRDLALRKPRRLCARALAAGRCTSSVYCMHALVACCSAW